MNTTLGQYIAIMFLNILILRRETIIIVGVKIPLLTNSLHNFPIKQRYIRRRYIRALHS